MAGTIGGLTYGPAKNATLLAVRSLECLGNGTISQASTFLPSKALSTFFQSSLADKFFIAALHLEHSSRLVFAIHLASCPHSFLQIDVKQGPICLFY